MKIIVVDDEKDVQLLFEQKFRREKRKGMLDFQFMLSAEEALEYLRTVDVTGIRLVLSDINMPGMNGLELLKIIRDKFPLLKVIIITAYGNDSYYQQAMEYGADDFITKPLDFDKLKANFTEKA
ncbi:MAG: response regulator [Calditrichia bacterium]